MNIDSMTLMRVLDDFYKEMKNLITNSGGALYPDEVVDRVIELLIEDGTWTKKILATFERMSKGTKRKGEVFETLTAGNKHIAGIVQATLTELGYEMVDDSEQEEQESSPEIPVKKDRAKKSTRKKQATRKRKKSVA